jgi:putative MFS transporter
MRTEATVGARLDRLPIAEFHWRVLGLIAAGLFFDGFDVHIASGVLGELVKEGISNINLNAAFISATLAGMAIGAALSGFVGDKLGRRYAYQINLGIFGLASIAGALAPNMNWLIAFRFVMGLGIGAEIVISYGMLAEFVPPTVRGKWQASLAFWGVAGLFVSTLLNYYIIPAFGWRWMFVIAGIGALIVLFLRQSLPESPRWLESVGRVDEADRIVTAIENEVATKHQLPSPDSSQTVPTVDGDFRIFFRQPVLDRLIVGIVLNVIIGMEVFGFIVWVPTFLVKHGLSVASSLGYNTLMSVGAPLGCVVAYFLSDVVGRKPALIGASLLTIVFGYFYGGATDPVMITVTGFLMFMLIHFLMTVGIGTYVNELFDTRYRLRAVGICSTFGRGAAMVTPFVVVAAFNYAGLMGVIGSLSAELVVLIIVLLAIGIETRGQTLEEIAAGGMLASAPTAVLDDAS